MGHRLHAAGHDDVGLAGLDHEVGEIDRVEARQAHLVDRGGGHVHADAGVGRGLAGGDLALAGEEHLAHEDVLDPVGRDAGPLERGLDGDATEVHGSQRCQRTRQLADRGTGTSDDHGPGHGSTSKRRCD